MISLRSFLPQLAGAAALAWLVTACGGSEGFEQPGPRNANSSAPPQVTEDEVAAAFTLRPQLPKPYRLGVYFRPNPDAGADPDAWRWEPQLKHAVLALTKPLRDSGEVADMFAIDPTTAVSDNLRAIRVAAARHGADAVLVVSGSDETRSGLNGWAASYGLLVPMLFAPGSQLDVRFTAHAEMWDVRNEYLYLAAEAEEEAHQQRALCWIDQKTATEQAQRGSVQLLAKELRQRFEGLHQLARR